MKPTDLNSALAEMRRYEQSLGFEFDRTVQCQGKFMCRNKVNRGISSEVDDLPFDKQYEHQKILWLGSYALMSRPRFEPILFVEYQPSSDLGFYATSTLFTRSENWVSIYKTDFKIWNGANTNPFVDVEGYR